MSSQYPQISANDRSHLICNLNGYLNNFDWQDEKEIITTGEALNFIFEPLRANALSISTGQERILNIAKSAFSLSSKTQLSLQNSVDAIFEFYSEPESWVLPQFSQEFRALVLYRVEQKALELSQCSSERCKELFNQRLDHNKRLGIWKKHEEKVTKALSQSDEILLNEEDQTLRYSIGCSLVENQDASSTERVDLCTIKNVFDSKVIAMKLLQHEPWHLLYFSKHVRADREIVSMAHKKSYYILQWASSKLTSCPQFVSECLQAEGKSIEYVNNYFYSDEFLYPLALKCNSHPHKLLEKCSKTLRSDEKKILPIIKYDHRAFFAASKSLTENPEFLLRACEINGLVLTCLNESYWLKANFLIAALKTPYNWLLPNNSHSKRMAILSIFGDFQSSKAVCLGLLKKIKDHSGDQRWHSFFESEQSCLKKFHTYLAYSNQHLWQDLNFWSQALIIEPRLIITALKKNRGWIRDLAVLEQLKSSNESVKSCLDLIISPINSALNIDQLARYFD